MSSEAAPTITVYDFLAWAETNKKILIGGFVAAVVLGFGIAIYRYNVDQKELAASDALLKLKPAIGAAEPAAPVDPGAYLSVAQRYAGTRAAERAAYLAAGALFEQGKYTEAEAHFKKFLEDLPQSPFAATAAYGIAAALEAQGKREAALTAYQNLSVRYPNSSVLDDAKLAVARIYEANNQPEQALRQYEELTKPGAMSSASSEAATRKQELLAKHPELAKTNAPAAAASVTLSNAPALQPTPAAPPATSTNASPAKR